MPSLCSLCSSISFIDLPPYPSSLAGHHIPFKADGVLLPYLTKRFVTPEGTRKSEPVGSLGLAHHPSLDDLQTAAKECDICALIDQSVDGVMETLELAKQDKFYVAYDKTGPPIWEFWLSKRNEGEDGFSVWTMASESEQAYLVGAVGFVVDDGEPYFLSEAFRSQHFAGPKHGIHC